MKIILKSNTLFHIMVGSESVAKLKQWDLQMRGNMRELMQNRMWPNDHLILIILF